MDPGRRAVEPREVAYVRVGDHLLDPDGVPWRLLEVAAAPAGRVTLVLGRLHGETVREVVRRDHDPDDRVRVRVRVGPTS